MHRYLLTIGPLTLYSYGALLALAFVCGAFVSVYRGRRRAIDADRVLDLIFVILLSSLAGARILFVALNWEYYRNNLADMFKIWEGGLVFYGGLLSGLAAAWLYLKRSRLLFGPVADVLSPGLALGIAIGRIGCFLNGCCWGRISYACGVRFPADDLPGPFAQQVSQGLIPASAAQSLPVLPTQLYESAACIVIALVLFAVERRKTFEGFLFWLFAALYAAARFYIEGLRFYEPNFFIGKLTVSQVISAALFVVSAVMLAAGSARAAQAARKT